jgi:hypothetical protein
MHNQEKQINFIKDKEYEANININEEHLISKYGCKRKIAISYVNSLIRFLSVNMHGVYDGPNTGDIRISAKDIGTLNNKLLVIEKKIENASLLFKYNKHVS